MESPQQTEKSQKKICAQVEKIIQDSEKINQSPQKQIANPNQNLKQSNDKIYSKDKKLDHSRYVKKIKSKVENESITSEYDDEEYRIEKATRKKRDRKNSDEQKLRNERAKQPKKELDHMAKAPIKQINFSQQPINENQVAKKRGRPKGSFNKNKKQDYKKQNQKRMKQFQCLKKIEPNQQEASSLSDQSQFDIDQKALQKAAYKMIDQKQKDSQAKLIQKSKNQQQSKIQEDQSASSSESEQQESQQQKVKEQQKNKKHNNQQSSDQASSQEFSQEQKQNIEAPKKTLQQNKQKQAILNQTSNQQSIAPFRAKKLAINSSSPSQNSQITANRNKIKKKQIVPEDYQQNLTQKIDLLPEQQELNILIRKRGRKSHQTQLEIQRLKQVIQQKKSNKLNIEIKNQIIQQKPRLQAPKNESQYKQPHQIKRNNQKPVQNKIVMTDKNQRAKSKIAENQMIDRKQLQKQVIGRKIKRLTLHSKIYSQKYVIQEHIDPLQEKLFKGWTKYYKKFNQEIVQQEQQEDIQQHQSHRKKPAKQKFKRYRKVIIQESCDSDEGYRPKKLRKQKKIKQPRMVFHEKKPKSKRKHKQSQSSDSEYD